MSRAALFALVAVAGCTAAPVAEVPALRSIEISNPGFELEVPAGSLCAPRWECSAHVDAGSFTFTVDASQASAGARSLRIERVRNEPWGVISQSVSDPALRGARVRFSVALRLQAVQGEGAGPFLTFHDASGRIIAGTEKLAPGSAGWSRASVEFIVPPATHLLEMGVLLKGSGRAWIDDARLDLLEPAAAAKNPV